MCESISKCTFILASALPTEKTVILLLTVSSPAVLYNNDAQNTSRLNTIKGFGDFYADMDANTLPQYLYITPNMCKL